MRAHTPPRSHHPHRPHPTWPAFPRHYLKAANACPHPPAPHHHPHRPHPTPPRPHHPHRPHHTAPLPTTHREYSKAACPHPPASSPPPPPTPPLARVSSPLHRPGSHFLGVLRVFKGCQYVPTPPRALTTPTAHTPPHPGLATTHTWLAFARCLESI